MKKALYPLIALTILLFSCNQSTRNQPAGTEAPEKPEETARNKTRPAAFDIQLFFKGIDGNVQAAENFRSSGDAFFCYDSQSFDHLTLIGDGNGYSLEVEANNAMVFTKDNFSIEGNATFGPGDFDFENGVGYRIRVQKDSQELFIGKVRSEGCL